jgi:hypothetical protein
MSTTQINLHYIRAAILANTGVDLGFDEIKKLLVEEKFITQSQASKIKILKNYNQYYDDYTIGRSSSSRSLSKEDKK